MLTQRDQRIGRQILVAIILVFIAIPVSAQDTAGGETRMIAMNASFDLLNQYVFRGVRQNSTEIVMWPAIDIAVTAHSSDRALKKVIVGFEFWNSLHTGDTGSAGPSGKPWYESRLNATVGLRFGGGFSVGTTYTAYASPNDMFTTVKELAIRLDLDDRKALRRGALRPYALVAIELDTQPGTGQLDGGLHAGRYLELGVSPGYSAKRASLAIPVKVGLSLSNYYELAGKDNRFGFGSVGGIVTVPIHKVGHLGSLNVHGGADFQVFGDTTKVFNGGERHKVIGLVGVGLSY